ncbi:MAG: DUF2207 domain-containing protein [Armatimonadetes bacterium]|nr:DUF2207 domain-containing protein [Armatimonadota bacterium]
MKKLAAAAILVALIAVPAGSFPIRSYNIKMEINPDSSVLVTEAIVADFRGEPHHGIFREIPFSGKDKFGNNIRIRHKIISVTDAFGNALQTKISGRSGRVRIRIGDPDVYVEDVRTYVIQYRLLRAVHFFQTYDELYWNAVGPEWEAPIEKAVCEVVLPGEVPAGELRAASYTGFYGATTSDALSDTPDRRTARFWMTRGLSPGEAMTIVVGWPKGIVRRPPLRERALWFAADNGYFFLPPLFLLFLAAFWIKAGRDPDTGRSEVVVYDPPDDLRPAELGTLIDERVDMRDISATIIDLAVRGYIDITASKEKGFFFSTTDYLLDLKKPIDQVAGDLDLKQFERDLIKGIFGAEQFRWTSTLKNKFYAHLPKLRDDLYDTMVKRGYFAYRPDSVRTIYRGGGIGMLAIGVVLAFVLSDAPFISVGWGIAIAFCGLVLAGVAGVMPRKTVKGKNALIGVRGFEEYLSRAERQEIEFQERSNYFEKFLPYAMALGIAERWARAFEGLQTTPPNWYRGDGVFSTRGFVHDLDAASYQWSSIMSSQSRSSGGGSSFFGGGSGFSGGSSGGGGGGGGGGGW